MFSLKSIRNAIAGIGCIVLPAVTFSCSQFYSRDSVEVSGFIEATQVRVGTRIQGTVKKLAAKEGDKVAKGDILAVLDRSDLEAQLLASEASMMRAEARLSDLQAGSRKEEIREAQAFLDQTTASLEQALQDTGRYAHLHSRNAAPEITLENTITQYEVSQARMFQAKQRLALLKAGSRPYQILSAKAELEQAKALVEAARINLSYTEIKAPITGIIQSKNTEAGEVVPANFTLYSIIDPTDLWVRVYIPESDIPKIRIGSKAQVSLDAFPDSTFRGSVTYIAPEAEFTPRNVQTKKERVNLVFEVKAALIDPYDAIKPGLPADVLLNAEEDK